MNLDVAIYTPSSMKIGELRHRIFSFIKAKFSSIATLRFKILTKIKEEILCLNSPIFILDGVYTNPLTDIFQILELKV